MFGAKKKDHASVAGVPPVFGRTLDEAPRSPGSDIPTLVEKVIAYIEAGHMQTEGIFRLNGAASVMNMLRERFDRREDVDLRMVSDQNAVAGTLKSYLRELAEPLLPFDFYEYFVAVANNFCQDNDANVRYVRVICRLLPKSHYAVLRRLMLFLHRLAQNSQVTRMSPATLATCIGPNILRQRNETAHQAVENTRHAGMMTTLLIEHAPNIFEHTGREPKYLQLAWSQHPYEARTAQELSFREHTLLFVLQAESSDGWIEAESRGLTGLVPQNYLEIAIDLTEQLAQDEQATLLSAQLKEELVLIKRQLKEDVADRALAADALAALLPQFQSLQERLRKLQEEHAALTERLKRAPKASKAAPAAAKAAPASIAAKPTAAPVAAAAAPAVAAAAAPAPITATAVPPAKPPAPQSVPSATLAPPVSKEAARTSVNADLDNMLAELDSQFAEFM